MELNNNGNYEYNINDPKLFEKIILSSLLERLKRVMNDITDDDIKNFHEKNIMTNNIIIAREILNKKNYEFLKQK